MNKRNLREETINLHGNHAGKIKVLSKVNLENEQDLSLVYTPGVADAKGTASYQKNSRNPVS
ncbi:hypothetical protein [Bacillus sp. MRMR6]|uniref:hypothetical protein n=1 Tax=Bacillus sp. MRMR6 TaxID=1928617 RepID=UPI0009522C06|nr:hypothetical protein [Bacillus sp. MRMR6]OLS37302.1 hypothetical protein BTR25_16205 [Bacillus sp. MRMR6]